MAQSSIHHVISLKYFSNQLSSILNTLGAKSNVATNLVILPSDSVVAAQIGITVHNGGHLGSYYAGIEDALTRLDGFVQSGGSADRARLAYDNFQYEMSTALLNGNLFTNVNRLANQTDSR